jgi:DNA-binding transcriptional LysR family regulator
MNSGTVFDWNDLRHFLAVARAGTTLGAARALGTSQPTVVRRVAALEAATGVALFERRPSGYALTGSGREILPLAERVEAEVQALSDRLGTLQRGRPGVIRITLPEIVDEFLFPALRAFQAAYPAIQLQLIVSYRRYDLARGEADVAIRVGRRPEGEGLLIRRLPDSGWTVYASRGYAAKAGCPSTPAELNGHTLVGADGNAALLPALQWLAREAPEAAIAWRCNSVVNLQAAVRSGLGVSALPCLAGGGDGELVACFPPVEELTTPLWLVTRRELRRMPEVRALLDAIAAHMQAHAALLGGQAPALRAV